MHHQRGLTVSLFSISFPFLSDFTFCGVGTELRAWSAEQESSCWAAYSLWGTLMRTIYSHRGLCALLGAEPRVSRVVVRRCNLCIFMFIWTDLWSICGLRIHRAEVREKMSKKVPYMDNNESWGTLRRSASPETCCSRLPASTLVFTIALEEIF